jgi:hypothetical protein
MNYEKLIDEVLSGKVKYESDSSGKIKEIRYNNSMKITFEGKEYLIDIDKAKELGVLKEDDSIKSFKIGDAFKLGNGNIAVIIETGYNPVLEVPRYSFTGLCNSLLNFSTFGSEGGTEEQVLNQLNKCKKSGGVVFVKNINEDIAELFKSLKLSK